VATVSAAAERSRRLIMSYLPVKIKIFNKRAPGWSHARSGPSCFCLR
jgi:hypothetical protein